MAANAQSLFHRGGSHRGNFRGRRHSIRLSHKTPNAIAKERERSRSEERKSVSEEKEGAKRREFFIGQSRQDQLWQGVGWKGGFLCRVTCRKRGA